MSEEAKDDVQQVKAERLQRPMGGLSVWCLCSRSKAAPPPEDKLKALIDLDAQQGKAVRLKG